MATDCKVGGCSNPVPPELLDQALCLEHFLGDIQERAGGFLRQLEADGPGEDLQRAATQFIVLSAARIVTIGTQNPPQDQLLRGRLLNAMLLLAELRERFDKAGPPKA